MTPKIAVFGDLMLDRYDYCENRHNPESSAPCHAVKKTTFLPGGAGNVAANLSKLGAEVTLFGVIGQDEHGRHLIQELSNFNIKKRILLDSQIKTIVKQRILSTVDGRYHGRLDFGDDTGDIAKLKSLRTQILEKIVPIMKDGFDACVISDYGKGFITEELVAEMKKLKLPIYADPKFNKELFHDIELIKPNRREISLMISNGDDRERARALCRELNTNVLLTLGSEGIYYIGKNGESFEVPSDNVDVLDVTGSGDTVLATFVFYQMLRKSLKASIELANKAAGINVQQIGCYHIRREEIEDIKISSSMGQNNKRESTIAIAGFPGAGSTTAAKLLSNNFRMNYFSMGQVFKDISTGRFKGEFYYDMLMSLCEERDVLIPEFSSKNDMHGATSLWETEFGKSKEFHNLLDELQVRLGNQGNIVIEGKLSLFMIPKANVKIWLFASIEERARRCAGRDNIPVEESIRLLLSRQERQKAEWQKIYGFNSLDQEREAHIIIDTTSLSRYEVLQKILVHPLRSK